jgi:hypothetical protein
MDLIQFNGKVKKLVNVYQYIYANGKSPGLGDFLRGCFCLLQVCKILNIEFDIDLSNHLISKFLLNVPKVENLEYNYIEYLKIQNRDKTGRSNYQDIIYNINDDYLNTIISILNKSKKEILGIFNHAFPLCNIHKPIEYLFLREKFRPNEDMQQYIESTLVELTLKKNEYSIIHIRSGDNNMENSNIIDLDLLYKIDKILINNILSEKKYIIISDCNLVKLYFQKYPNFFFIVKNICHLGGESFNYLQENAYITTKNTMLDFYLMSYSNSILSLSVYDHISSFSKYCGIIYNIPFNAIKI